MLSVSATGCHFESREPVVSKQETVDPQIVELRGKYLLTAAPEGVVSIYDAKRSLDDKPQVVLTGRIGAGKQIGRAHV